jgi:Flp pilus assembly protein TadG
VLWNDGSPLRRAFFVPVLVAVGAVLALLVRSALPGQPVREKVRMQPAAAAAAEYLTHSPAPSASPQTSASASSPSPSHSPSPSATSSASSGGSGCAAAYTVTKQWQGGFQVSVTVTAGARPISAWTVGFAFANGQSVTQSWSAALSQSGSAVTADNLSWDGALTPGTSTTFGFLAGLSDSANSVPVVKCAAR